MSKEQDPTQKNKKVKKPKVYKEFKYMTVQEIWARLKNEEPLKGKVDYFVFRKIISDLTYAILEEVFINPQGFSLPNRLGLLQMVGIKRKCKSLHIDYSLLAHTDGYNYKIRHLYGRSTKSLYLELYRFVENDMVKKTIVRRIKQDDFFHYFKFESFKEMVFATDIDSEKRRVILSNLNQKK